MLKLVGNVLAEMNLVPADASLRYYINISTGYAMSISAYLDCNTFFQVKVSEYVDLSAEFDALHRGWTQYPGFVPQPLGKRERDGWSITVTRGVQHVPFGLDAALRGQRKSQQALRELQRYFDESGRQSRPGDCDRPHAAFLTDLECHFLKTPHSRIATKWINLAKSLGAESLPCTDQHGDFTENNLARSGDHLVIFDWEDYGTCSFPGLDLTSLVFSAFPGIQFHQALINAGASSSRPPVAFIRQACRSCGFDMPFYQQLLPFYLLVLLYSKRNYGRPLQDRIGNLLGQLTK